MRAGFASPDAFQLLSIGDRPMRLLTPAEVAALSATDASPWSSVER